MSEQTVSAMALTELPSRKSFFKPHRIVLMAIAAILVFCVVWFMRWDWVPKYSGKLAHGVGVTLLMLFSTAFLGFLLAVPIGLVQVTGPWPLKALAKGFCTVIRGTPLLLQLWLLYYGLGSLFPQFPSIRHSFLWPYLRDGLWYAVFALSLNQAAYNAEVIRGAILAVPKGQIEAAVAVGMRPFTILRRVTLPQALRLCLPVLTSDVIILLKSTSLASTITIMEMMGTARMMQRQSLLIFEPLIAAGLLYFAVVVVLTRVMAEVERRLTLYRQPARPQQG